MKTKTPDLIFPDWPAPKKVKGFVTQRKKGWSKPPYNFFNLSLSVGDNITNVSKNRKLLRQILPNDPCWLDQVHGTKIVKATATVSPVEADASFTRQVNTVCALMIADCIPVLVCDRQATFVAAIHAGWRGLLNGILENAVSSFDSPPSNLLVYLGPSIGPTAFEIGPDVFDKIIAQNSFKSNEVAEHPLPNKWFANLAEIAKNRLKAIGVHSVFESGLCTFNNPKSFYSHRRDNPTGRMAACIWLDGEEE